MAMKHTKFMKLAQGNKSLTEYLQAFNNLARYATEFVDTDAKKIASFKRGLSPKLTKTMGTSKCATFNEFISDALTQENNNSIYAASKSHKRAFEAGASQSQALVAPRAPSRPPTTGAMFRPRRRRLQPRLGFTRLIQFLFLRVVLAKVALVFLQVTCLARTATSQVIGLGIVLIRRRMQIKVAVRGTFIILALKRFPRVRWSLPISS
jgi:hypothetical protein